MAVLNFCSTGVGRVQEFMLSRLVKGALRGLADTGFSERAQKRVQPDLCDRIEEALQEVTEPVLARIYEEAEAQLENDKDAAYGAGYEAGSESGYQQGVEDTEHELGSEDAQLFLDKATAALPIAERTHGCSAFLLRVNEELDTASAVPCPHCSGALALQESAFLCSTCRTVFTLQPR